MHKERDVEQPRLIRLEEMKKFRVAKGEPDIRDWEVVSSDRRNIGKVHDLIVDTASMKVRYLDVIVGAKILGTKTPSHVLIPIAGATLDDDDNRVYLDDVSLSHLTSMPPYDHRPITRDYESTIRGLFASAMEPAAAPAPVAPPPPPVAAAPVVAEPAPTVARDEFYDAPQFSDRNFWGRRRAGRENVPYVTREEELADEPLPDLPPDLKR